MQKIKKRRKANTRNGDAQKHFYYFENSCKTEYSSVYRQITES